MTSTTTQSVKFHGWTLPAGATVTIDKVTLPHSGQQAPTASCKAPEFSEWGFSVPVYALGNLDGVPVYRLNEITSREELVG